MALRALLLLLALTPVVEAQQATRSAIQERYGSAANRLIDAALDDSAAYRRLGELVDRFGHRFSGSASLERAIDWMLTEMRKDGLDNVRGEPVMVPRWVRGSESVELVEPRVMNLPMLGLAAALLALRLGWALKNPAGATMEGRLARVHGFWRRLGR